jgi:hypothetical protein
MNIIIDSIDRKKGKLYDWHFYNKEFKKRKRKKMFLYHFDQMMMSEILMIMMSKREKTH